MDARLKKLLLVLEEIYPKEETENPFYRIELHDYPDSFLHCHRLLTHYITLIYKIHRPMNKKRYITSREDVMASLQLLELVTLKHYRSEKKQSEELHETLKINTQENQILTAKQIREIIGYSKTHTQRFINILLKQNKMERVSNHHPSIGYLYRLK